MSVGVAKERPHLSPAVDRRRQELGSGPLTLGTPKRLIAHGWVDIDNSNTNPGTQANATCIFESSDEPGSSSTFKGPQDLTRIPESSATRVPIAGFVDLDPGTYEVLVTCRGSASLALNDALVTVTVADQ